MTRRKTLSDYLSQRRDTQKSRSQKKFYAPSKSKVKLLSNLIREPVRSEASDASWMLIHLWNEQWRNLDDGKDSIKPTELLEVHSKIHQLMELMGSLGIISETGANRGYQHATSMVEAWFNRISKETGQDIVMVRLAFDTPHSHEQSCLH